MIRAPEPKRFQYKTWPLSPSTIAWNLFGTALFAGVLFLFDGCSDSSKNSAIVGAGAGQTTTVDSHGAPLLENDPEFFKQMWDGNLK